jgi:hypothetical protein
MTSGNAQIDTSDRPEAAAKAAEAIYQRIRDSFALAIRGLPTISPGSVQVVLDTVDDAVTNHFDELVACVEPVWRGKAGT